MVTGLAYSRRRCQRSLLNFTQNEKSANEEIKNTNRVCVSLLTLNGLPQNTLVLKQRANTVHGSTTIYSAGKQKTNFRPSLQSFKKGIFGYYKHNKHYKPYNPYNLYNPYNQGTG
jgi:hypothetical protein